MDSIFAYKEGIESKGAGKPEVFVAQKRERVGCGEWNLQKLAKHMKFGSLKLYPRIIIDDNNGMWHADVRCLPSWIQLVLPSPTKPGLQVHLYEPTVFWHNASLWQSFIKSLRHSSWSIRKYRQLITALKHKNNLMFNVRRLCIYLTKELEHFIIASSCLSPTPLVFWPISKLDGVSCSFTLLVLYFLWFSSCSHSQLKLLLMSWIITK